MIWVGILLGPITVAVWSQGQPQAALQAKGTLSQSCELCLPQWLSMSTSHFGWPFLRYSRAQQPRPQSAHQMGMLSLQHSRMSEARVRRRRSLSRLATLQMLEAAAAQVKMRHSPALSWSRWVAAGGWYQAQISRWGSASVARGHGLTNCCRVPD